MQEWPEHPAAKWKKRVESSTEVDKRVVVLTTRAPSDSRRGCLEITVHAGTGSMTFGIRGNWEVLRSGVLSEVVYSEEFVVLIPCGLVNEVTKNIINIGNNVVDLEKWVAASSRRMPLPIREGWHYIKQNASWDSDVECLAEWGRARRVPESRDKENGLSFKVVKCYILMCLLWSWLGTGMVIGGLGYLYPRLPRLLITESWELCP